MRKEKLYKVENVMGRTYQWSAEPVWDDWNHIYSTPFWVEVPDGFNLAETICGDKMYFRDGCKYAYSLTIGDSGCENSAPYLIGGSPVERIRLKVIGPAEER